jgi:hypothetical protein
MEMFQTRKRGGQGVEVRDEEEGQHWLKCRGVSRREGHIQRTPFFTFSESGGIGYLRIERDWQVFQEHSHVTIPGLLPKCFCFLPFFCLVFLFFFRERSFRKFFWKFCVPFVCTHSRAFACLVFFIRVYLFIYPNQNL